MNYFYPFASFTVAVIVPLGIAASECTLHTSGKYLRFLHFRMMLEYSVRTSAINWLANEKLPLFSTICLESIECFVLLILLLFLMELRPLGP